MNSIKAFVFGHETNLSVDGHTLLSHLFPELSLDSLYKTRARVAYLADLRPLDFDACPSGCMAFTAVTEPPLTACTYCGEERFDAKGKRRGVYSFLDPAQVLKAQLENAERRDLLRYPHTRSDDPSRISDYLDCTHYSTLRKTLIPDTPSTAARVRYFANEFHVPLLLLTDGIGVWRKLSVWPILAVNLALPPTSRNRIDELLVLGLIHGSPKDLDSFLRPVVDAGITATSSGFLVAPTPSETVTARYSYILSGADARAKEKWTKSKGSNAIRGCLECTIVGVRDHERKGTTHYRALKLPNNLDLARFPKATDSDPLKLSKRTSKDYLLQGKAVELSADQDFASAAYGMNGVPILSRLSSIDVLLSFPNEYLHLLPLNNCKNLFKLLCGEFKDLDEGIERYQFFEGGRAECGRRVVAAQRTMPTLFGRAIPNPDTDLHLWTGSDFSSFFQFYAPWALRDQIPKAAYDHVLSLHRIMNRINLRSITRVQLTELRVWIAKFVQEWER